MKLFLFGGLNSTINTQIVGEVGLSLVNFRHALPVRTESAAEKKLGLVKKLAMMAHIELLHGLFCPYRRITYFFHHQ